MTLVMKCRSSRYRGFPLKLSGIGFLSHGLDVQLKCLCQRAGIANKTSANGSPPTVCVCVLACVCMCYVVSAVDEGAVTYSIATKHRAIQ